MRALGFTIASILLAACANPNAGHVDGGVLGRVVVYRNGVAFYERHARVQDGKLTVHVPRDRVDDFLKSLTVVDPITRKPLSVTIPRKEADDGSYLTMTLETADLKQADVLLTYVTEAPAWKPSYRVVVGADNSVMLEGWAIVDNTTTEDWKGVLVGVGASSALAFRYDLWSVRAIDRDLLAGEDRFAIAPPTGISPYAEAAGTEELASLDPTEVRADAKATAKSDPVGVSFSGSSSLQNEYVVDGINTTSVTYGGGSGASGASSGNPVAQGVRGVVRDTKSGELLVGVTVVAINNRNQSQAAITDESGAYALQLEPGSYTISFYYGSTTTERKNVRVGSKQIAKVDQKLSGEGFAGETIQVTASAPMIESQSTSQAVRIDRMYMANIPLPGRTFENTLGAAAGSQGDSGSSYKPPPPIKQGDEKLKAIVAKIMKEKKDVVIETRGQPGTEKDAAARAQAVKNKLVDDGVPAARIHVVPKLGPNEGTGIRVLAVAPQQPGDKGKAPPTAQTRDLGGDTPVGESHFMADRPMTVRAGTSAMVAMVHGKTTGGVVYLYDPISDRGDQRFAFKSVRLDNPTTDTLEPGPVTVYGDGRFIGEGITEPVPPKASVVVPFALDKQVVVTRSGAEDDRIAKLVTLQRGILTAEVQHRRKTTFTITSRLAIPAKVYLRHRLAEGWALTEAPSKFTKVGDSQLFEVMLAAGETASVAISEATPVTRTFELASPEALGMMKVFIDEPSASPQLKTQIAAMLATHRSAADLVDKILTLREQAGEYRARAGELHAQLVTLKLVKTGGELMASLRSKLGETEDKIQKITIALVDTQEQLMLARVKFQNQLAELRVEDATRISGR